MSCILGVDLIDLFDIIMFSEEGEENGVGVVMKPGVLVPSPVPSKWGNIEVRNIEMQLEH